MTNACNYLDTTMLSAGVSAIVSWGISKWQMNVSESTRLNDLLMQVNQICIEYPYLEDSNFTNTWKNTSQKLTEKYLRYESYCIILFNYLERLAIYTSFNKKKMEKFVHVKEIIEIHHRWWQSPSIGYKEDMNISGYSDKFRNLVDEYLK